VSISSSNGVLKLLAQTVERKNAMVMSIIPRETNKTFTLKAMQVTLDIIVCQILSCKMYVNVE